MAGERLPEAAKGQVTQMLAEMRDAIASYQQVEERIKMILASAGVHSIQNPYYLSFGRQVKSAMTKGLTGDQLLKTVNIYLNNWVAQGLDQDILEKIRNTIFTLGAPGA